MDASTTPADDPPGPAADAADATGRAAEAADAAGPAVDVPGPAVDAPTPLPAVAGARERTVGSNRRHLAIVLAVALVTLGVDIVAAMASGSLALVADAAHRVTDVVGIAIAFGAATVAARPATLHRSFGYARAEVIAACVNAGLLVALGIFIAVEAVGPDREPRGARARARCSWRPSSAWSAPARRRS